MPLFRPSTLPFRSRRFQISRSDAVLSREGLRIERTAARPFVLIARSLLRVRRVSLPAGLSRTDAWGALRAQALAWQPFHRSVVQMGIAADGGLLLAWDAALVAEAAVQLGVDPERIRWQPECVWCASGDGVRLLQGQDGFEAQYWSDGMLQLSRWWPEHPLEQDWQEFNRLLPVNVPRMQVPHAPVRPPMTAPWIQLLPLEQDPTALRGWERLVVAGLVLTLSLSTVPTLRAHVDLGRQRADLERQLESRQEQLAKTQSLIQRAGALSADARALAADLAGPQPLRVLMHLAEVLPREGVQLREFDLDGQRLRLVFELTPAVSRGALVSRLQQGGWFAEVVEQTTVPRAGWVAYAVRLAAHTPGSPRPASSASMPATRSST